MTLTPAALTLIDQGERHVTYERRFAAPPPAVWRAFTEPALLQQWCIGPDGGSMPVCEMDTRPGGRFHWEFGSNGYAFHTDGDFLEVEPPSRMVHVERMHLPQEDGTVMVTPDNRVTTEFAPEGEGTRMTIRMEVPDAKSLTQMLASGMTDGMETSYARIDGLMG